jgi:hypothetical protein
MWKQIHDNANYIVPILLSVTTCSDHDCFEQYFKQKGLVIDLQHNHIKELHVHILVTVKVGMYTGT